MKKKRKSEYTHTRTQMHMIARMQEILYSQRISHQPSIPLNSTPTFPSRSSSSSSSEATRGKKGPKTHRIRHDPHLFPFPTTHPPSASPLRPSPKITKTPLQQTTLPTKNHTASNTTSSNNPTTDMKKRKNKAFKKPTRLSSRSPRTSTPHYYLRPLYHHHSGAGP